MKTNAVARASEEKRLETLHEYEILDTEREQAFDDLAALASYICETPISAVSLIDEHRQWFKSSVGLSDRETPRGISFCQHAILEEEILIVPDATKDDRFKDSPLVTAGLKLQFYAGVPLIAPNGCAIGALCVKDSRPRTLTADQLDALKRLARQVVGQLELRRKNLNLEDQTRILEEHTADLMAAHSEAMKSRQDAHAAMEEMRVSQERFHLVCKATKDVIWDLDLATSRAWISDRYRDNYASKTTGDTATISEWIEGIHPEDRSRVSESFGEAITSGASTWNCEYRLARHDGTYADVFDRAFLLQDEKGRAVRIIGAVSDMTDRKQAERDRLERENADKANQAKSHFLSRMSHELRTPLNSILGFAQLLEMYQPTDQQKECIGRIMTGGKHLLGLINEVLDLSRIESGAMEISLEGVKVSNVIEEAIGLMNPLADSFNVTIRKSVAFDSDLFARADRQRLLQVVINLLANAIKYNVDGGSVSIELGSNEVGTVSIAVHDTGHGISPEVAHRVFMPFDRLGIEQDAQIEGTGLGLALSKNLIDAMHGRIDFTSDFGVGTTFLVELQSAEVPEFAWQASTRANVAEALDQIKVLYIEDNESNVALMQSIVAARTNWSLEIAMTGADGLNSILANAPDIVLLDLDLPDMPGIDVLARLSAMRSHAPMPVLIVSADATQERVDRLLRAGASGYIAKPIDVRELIREVTSRLACGETVAA